MIVGNVAEYIERCLLSFGPHVDEISLVRAIGNQAPDDTEAIARTVSKFLGKPLVWGEYQNRPENASWPHVDDFAAARNKSFDQSHGEYCVWADSDDILKSGGETLRRHAEDGSYAAFLLPYDIFGKNVVVQRERLVLRDSGRWKHPVHEFFEFKNKSIVAATDDSIVVQHLPKLEKRGSNDRNLRILESIPPDQMTSGLWYHLFNELVGAGRLTEAVTLGAKLIEGDDLGKDERYDVLMQLVMQTTNLDERRALLHEAHRTDPTRREALGILACTMIDDGKPEWAMAYARQMAATLRPAQESWNSRKPFYGYVGDDIYQQALRACGRFVDAEKVRRSMLQKNGGPRIALLHATRGRAVKASQTRKAWHDMAAQPERIEHIFAIDADDEGSSALRRFHHVVVAPGGGCVRAWNAAALHTEAPILVQLSDDWTPVANWDDIICQRIGDPGAAKVLAISDGIRTDKLLCMAICTRPYYQVDNFLFHPWFTGVYSDNWFTHCAYQRGAVIEARDVVFRHHHPYSTGELLDETYERQNAPERYAEGKALMEYLLKGNDWSYVPGFFDYQEFYTTMASGLKDGETAVEIGSWLGRSVIYLAQTLQRMGKHKVKLVVVDTFKGESNQKEHEATVRIAGGSLRHKFEENIQRCGVADMIQVIEGDSAESAALLMDGSVTFCFIDAAHDYDSVTRDIKAWLPKVRAGGVIAGHDYDWHEVKKAVGELLPDAKQAGSVWVKSN